VKTALTALALALAAGNVSAATLTFDGAICGGTCGNGDAIDQTYGDISGQVDVIYDASRNTTALENVFHWSTGYDILTSVAFGNFGGGGMSIVFAAATGYDILLTGFDIAPYVGRTTDTLVQIIDLATNILLINDTYTPLNIAGITSYAGTWTSTVGLQINLGPDVFDVGIDNIAYSAVLEGTGPVPIPLPAIGLLLIGALAGLGRLRRRA